MEEGWMIRGCDLDGPHWLGPSSKCPPKDLHSILQISSKYRENVS